MKINWILRRTQEAFKSQCPHLQVLGRETTRKDNSFQCYILVEGRTTTLLYKNVYVFLFIRKRLRLLRCVRDRRRRGKLVRLLYWPLTSSLDHSSPCFFQVPTWHFFSTGLLNRGLGVGPILLQATYSDSKLALTQPSLPPTDQRAFAYIVSKCLQLPIISRDIVRFIYAGAFDWRLSQESICSISSERRWDLRHVLFCFFEGIINKLPLERRVTAYFWKLPSNHWAWVKLCQKAYIYILHQLENTISRLTTCDIGREGIFFKNYNKQSVFSVITWSTVASSDMNSSCSFYPVFVSLKFLSWVPVTIFTHFLMFYTSIF